MSRSLKIRLGIGLALMVLISFAYDKVVEFVNERIEELQHEVAAKHGYDIVSHNMVLFVRPKKKAGGSD